LNGNFFFKALIVEVTIGLIDGIGNGQTSYVEWSRKKRQRRFD